MNRQAFIGILRAELSKLPPEEIDEATEYFEECFDDAAEGLEGESLTAEEERLAGEFGDPKKIAAQIKAEYAARLLGGEGTAATKKPGSKKILTAVWWIIIGLCSAPVFIPLAICVIAIVFAIYIVIAAGIVGSVSGIFVGISCLTASAAAGIMGIGICLMLLAVSLGAAYAALLATRAVVRKAGRCISRTNAERKARRAYDNSSDDGDRVASVDE